MGKDKLPPRDIQSKGNNEEDAFDLFGDLKEMTAAIPETEKVLPQEEPLSEETTVVNTMYKQEPEEPVSFDLEQTARVLIDASDVHQMQNENPVGQPVSASRQEVQPLETERLEKEERRVSKMIRIFAIVGVGTLFLMCIAVFSFYYFLQGHHKSSQAEKDSSSIEDVVYDGQELYGVITELDTEMGTVAVYTAETGETKTFDLNQAEKITDQYGSEIGIVNLHRGQVVNVQYNAAKQDAVSLFRLTSKVTELKNVYGAILFEDMLTVSGASYSIDENLICLYQGQDYDIHQLSMQQIFTAKIIDGHIYTIYVSYSTGELELEDYGEYLGGQLTVTSIAGGTATSVDITENMEPLQVLEGMNSVTITMDAATVYSGNVFIVGGETYQLKLPASSERIGKVTLVAEPESASIMIDGVNYAVGETIELTYGQHELVAYADGYSTYSKTITIGQPYQRLLIDMTNNITMLSITSALNGSVVYIDGEYYGTAPIRIEMAPGTYMVTLVTEGYKDVTMSVTITEGKLEQVLYFSEFTPEEPDQPAQNGDSQEGSSSSIPEPPSSSVPESSVPESSVPESSVPESSVPESSVPESSVPESSVPESSVPESSVPESSVPESSVPESSVPESSEPEVPVDPEEDTTVTE